MKLSELCKKCKMLTDCPYSHDAEFCAGLDTDPHLDDYDIVYPAY